MVNDHALRDARSLSAREIYEVIRRDGEEELARPLSSLVWSGIAAGLLISFSVLGEAILRSQLPQTGWRYLVENLGYSLGFLLVILGRMQLFTENTITTVLPLAQRRSLACLGRTATLWAVVLGANVVGTALAALFLSRSGVFAPDVMDAIVSLSKHATGFGAWEGFLRGVPAGVLIAAIVWMLPGQSGGGVIVIVLFTWLIAAGDFTHIVAGSVEMWVLLSRGDLGPVPALLSFFIPVLAGNIVGGTLIFTLLAWNQVKDEIPEGEAQDSIPGTFEAEKR